MKNIGRSSFSTPLPNSISSPASKWTLIASRETASTSRFQGMTAFPSYPGSRPRPLRQLISQLSGSIQLGERSRKSRDLTGTAPDVLQLVTNVSVVRRRGAGTMHEYSARPSAK
ncbi:hypothetical protein EXIGLDRAFT_284841 [Exidia glandulosa HHB12029]|uniref:Uncharacterized protein n=1 Tax=Exidia glandulosa HHB12029 TaxID=1314781 RepID=A0A165M3R6_EXIGL|nr:hypothetical protein EXIGLDRAFT_284841 [Exidia glandulosa HHB12029]